MAAGQLRKQAQCKDAWADGRRPALAAHSINHTVNPSPMQVGSDSHSMHAESAVTAASPDRAIKPQLHSKGPQCAQAAERGYRPQHSAGGRVAIQQRRGKAGGEGAAGGGV